MSYDVSIAACPSYDAAVCREALDTVLAPLGGLDFVKPGMNVIIKVNLVSAMKPEQAATTHPTLLCELTKMLLERGASVLLGDSPGGLYTPGHLSHVYDVSGMREVQKCGAALNDDCTQRTVSFPEAKVCKNFTYTAYLDKADVLIDFCKLKSHGMMGMSNAAKNLFGVIPGIMKPEYHYQYPRADLFADMLIDLNNYFKPTLSICDAVVAMEGNGPTQGTAKKVGAVAASLSPHKLDLLCAKLMGLGVDDVPTLKAAFDRGLIPETADALSVAGDYAPFISADFSVPPAQTDVGLKFMGKGAVGEFIDTFLQHTISPKPNVHKNTCIGCGKCAGICPAHAIEMRSKLPVIDRKKCIHCFCCQEFCPKGAMYVHRSPIARIITK